MPRNRTNTGWFEVAMSGADSGWFFPCDDAKTVVSVQDTALVGPGQVESTNLGGAMTCDENSRKQHESLEAHGRIRAVEWMKVKLRHGSQLECYPGDPAFRVRSTELIR